MVPRQSPAPALAPMPALAPAEFYAPLSLPLPDGAQQPLQSSGSPLHDSGSGGVSSAWTGLGGGGDAQPQRHCDLAAAAPPEPASHTGAHACNGNCDGLCCLANAAVRSLGCARADAGAGPCGGACCCQQAPPGSLSPGSTVQRLLALAEAAAAHPTQRWRVLLALRAEIEQRRATSTVDPARDATLARLHAAVQRMLEQEGAGAAAPPSSPSAASGADASHLQCSVPTPPAAASPPPPPAARHLFPQGLPGQWGPPQQAAGLPAALHAFLGLGATECSPHTADSAEPSPARPVRPVALHRALPPAVAALTSAPRGADPPLPLRLMSVRAELLHQRALALIASKPYQA